MENRTDEVLGAFLREFSTRLPRARRALQTMSAGQEVSASVNEVNRFFHSLAGVAGSVGFPVLGRLASVCEGVITLVEKKSVSDPRQVWQLLNDGLDACECFFRQGESQDLEQVTERLSPASFVEPVLQSAQDSRRELSKIVIIDDDPLSGKLIDVCLQKAGYLTFHCQDPNRSLEVLAAEAPDLIILDVVMPGMDGFELCEKIREQPLLQLVPIIFVTRKTDISEKVKGLQVGANDYLSKPFEPEELVARVAAHLERLSVIREMAIRDGLTRTYNHKYLKVRLEQELQRADRYQLPLSLAMIDLDHFKEINDRHGHQAGDVLLCQFVRFVSAQLRNTDVVARYGGEEFAILLVQTPLAPATAVMKRICQNVARTPFTVDLPGQSMGQLELTISIGLAERQSPDDRERIIQRADQALYVAKRTGRNRVEIQG